MKLEHDVIKRNERGGVYTDQFDDFQLKCIEFWKNTSFISTFGCNCPIVSIDGYHGTVHRGPFRLSRGQPILMNGLDAPRG